MEFPYRSVNPTHEIPHLAPVEGPEIAFQATECLLLMTGQEYYRWAFQALYEVHDAMNGREKKRTSPSSQKGSTARLSKSGNRFKLDLRCSSPSTQPLKGVLPYGFRWGFATAAPQRRGLEQRRKGALYSDSVVVHVAFMPFAKWMLPMRNRKAGYRFSLSWYRIISLGGKATM